MLPQSQTRDFQGALQNEKEKKSLIENLEVKNPFILALISKISG